MKKIFHILTALAGLTVGCALTAHAQGGVAINAAGLPPDNSALLDVSGTNKGELMPRLSTAQRNAIANPAKGLFIYNTDCDVINYNAGTSGNPVWATVNATNVLSAGVSIAANPIGAVCSGTGVTFTASPAAGINSPSYQWQVNGSNVGTNSDTYTSTGLNNGDVVTCILSSNEACVTGSPATSNAITMLVNTVPGITGTTPAAFCSGSAVTLSASANIGTINWYADSTGGSSLSSGASFTVSGLTSSKTYYVDATATGCTTASRTAVTATFYPNAPGQPGNISGPSTANKNDTVTYSVSALPNTDTYAWTVILGIITSGQGTNTIHVTWGDSSGIGSVSVTANNPCGTSSAQSITVGLQEDIYSYTGSVQTFTVPAGSNSVTLQCWGAQGQSSGGQGGYATGNLAVTPGEQLGIYVGGQNGYNGGGTGNSGNGGGASDVRQAGTGLNNRVIVAGGGGGGYGGPGGAGGGLSGGASPYSNNGNPAQGGTQSAGGNWGGTFGTGGNSDNNYGGSGGGGGWYGGGSNNTQQGSPVTNSAGGGGSGYIGGVTGGSMQTGIRTGDGQIIITW